PDRTVLERVNAVPVVNRLGVEPAVLPDAVVGTANGRDLLVEHLALNVVGGVVLDPEVLLNVLTDLEFLPLAKSPPPDTGQNRDDHDTGDHPDQEPVASLALHLLPPLLAAAFDHLRTPL